MPSFRATTLIITIAAAAACAASQPEGPAPRANASIAVEAVPVALNSQDASMQTIGAFTYAGGLVLTAAQTDQLHGLSDIDVSGSTQLTAVGDLGVLLSARLVLDQSGRLSGIADAHLEPLTDEHGRPLIDKADADAEGLAVLANGDRLVSFERRNRIWLYPAAGGPPRLVPFPEATFPLNAGMEAVAADPETGADAYVVGAEDSGETWSCRVSAACTQARTVEKHSDFGLVAIRRLPGNRTVYLLRAFDEARGNRLSLQIFDTERLISRLDLARPLTVDNYEGVAAVPAPGGGFRFYLLSDDNASNTQRTLLIAFDWRPPS